MDTIDGESIVGLDIKHSIRYLIAELNYNLEDRIRKETEPFNYFLISEQDLLYMLSHFEFIIERKRKNMHLRPVCLKQK